MTKKPQQEFAFQLVSKHTLAHLSSDEKLDYIIKEVKQGRILILETGLTPLEQTKLIQTTMHEINHDSFVGIEIGGYEPEHSGHLRRMFGIPRRPKTTIIGPAHLLRLIHKDDTGLDTTVNPKKGA